jgi:membrane fusion protein, multidrug efflux system
MAFKIIYPVVAVIGIGAVSGAAWWYQNKPTASAEAASSAAAASTSQTANAPSGAASAARPPSVEVAKVEIAKLTDDTQAVGNLRSRQGIVLRPEVSGRITQLNFKDGDRVRKGQLLVQLDDQLPLAQVKQSQAELSIATANHKRNQELVGQNFISQRSVDESAANLDVALAKLALSQATAARLKITAPFDGMTGIRTVNPGDYLKDGADIVNIEDIDAVFVDFRLPERFQTKVKRGQKAIAELDALPGRKFDALVVAIDPLIDANGRSVGVRACIDNRQLQLRPGMFARVTAVFGQRDKAKVVPEEAIVPQGARQFVLKVMDGPDKDTKVTQRVEVKVGIRRPGRVEILEGVEEGDVVVVAGQQRVQRDGTPVRVLDVPSRGQGGAPPGGGAAGAAGGPVAAAPATGASAAVAAATATPVAPPSAGSASNAKGRPAMVPAQGTNPCLVSVADAPGGGRPAGVAAKS